MTGNRQIVVAEVPDGALRPDHYAARVTEVPAPGDGQVLVRTRALTIGAGQRAGLQGSASYAGAAKADIVMGGTGIGEVIESRHPSFTASDTVMGMTGWQEYAAVSGDELTPVAADLDPAVMLGPLGTNGLAAYFGMLGIGDPGDGDTVVVSAAAGSVGHVAGQIAKIHGGRIVGIAGSAEKCRMLTDELGFDLTVNYKDDDFRDQFKAATPDRIDVYFDNTGGDILGSALFRMNLHGRIVCCGVVSQYDTANPAPGPRGIPGLLVNNRVRMEGYVVFDYARQFTEAREQMSSWIRDGRLTPKATIYDGLDSAPQAFVDLLGGVTVGTTVVRVAD